MNIEKAILGMRYLIKYANKPNQAYFSIIKDCSLEIRLWCIITLLTNHIDDFGETVPDFVFEDLFLMNKVDTKNGNLEYGRGYSSLSLLPFKEQFRLIRNNLAHQDFTFDDGVIYLNDENQTKFDLQWLESLVLQTISSNKHDFKKGMKDISVLTFIAKDQPVDFNLCWKAGLIQFVQITLLTGNQEKVADYFKDTHISKEHFTFNLLCQAVSQKLSSYQLNFLAFLHSSNGLRNILNQVEEFFGHFIQLDFVHSDLFDSIVLDEGFQQLSFYGKLQYLINKLKLGEVHSYNSIIVHELLKILKNAENDIYQYDQLFILRDSTDFLLKVYANILFSSVYTNEDKNVELKNYIQNHFNLIVHFEHAKNIYQKYIKVLKRSYEETKEHYAPVSYRAKLLTDYQEYMTLLEEVVHGEYDKRLFWNMRNAIIHNQIEFNDHQVRLYTTGRNINLRHFDQKRGQWVFKEFKNKQVIWEMVMEKDEFLRLLDELSELAHLPIQINISKYVRKKEKK